MKIPRGIGAALALGLFSLGAEAANEGKKLVHGCGTPLAALEWQSAPFDKTRPLGVSETPERVEAAGRRLNDVHTALIGLELDPEGELPFKTALAHPDVKARWDSLRRDGLRVGLLHTEGQKDAPAARFDPRARKLRFKVAHLDMDPDQAFVLEVARAHHARGTDREKLFASVNERFSVELKRIALRSEALADRLKALREGKKRREAEMEAWLKEQVAAFYAARAAHFDALVFYKATVDANPIFRRPSLDKLAVASESELKRELILVMAGREGIDRRIASLLWDVPFPNEARTQR